MPLPQLVERTTAACDIVERWRIEEELAQRVKVLAELFYDGRVGIRIISGYRSPETQAALLAVPDSAAAPVDVSNHTICPARALDLDPVIEATGPVKAELGRVARLAGLRWGGGAPVGQDGIPVKQEWRHVDLGPRPR